MTNPFDRIRHMTWLKGLAAVGALVAVLTLWVGWPVYGFVSNQFEVARLPLGWKPIPEKIPTAQTLYDEAYAGAGQSALTLLEDHRAKINAPSLSAAIVMDGELVWAGAVGWQDIASKTPATPKTVYRIGSTSKPTTITGLARLVSQGQLDLDAAINSYASLPNPEWNEMTLRRLASHTAGLRGYENNDDWVGLYQGMALQTRFKTPVKALSVFDGASLEYPFGTDFSYSGFDNVLISAIIENVTPNGFVHFMQQDVFDIAGAVSFEPDYLDHDPENTATHYQHKDGLFKPWRPVDLSHKLAAGGYQAAPSDVARLGALWLDETFIPPAVREEFWVPVALKDGTVNEQNYALGWRLHHMDTQPFGTVRQVNHGGVSKGAQCWLMILPEQKMVVAISTNRRTEAFFDFAEVYQPLVEAFLPVRPEPN